MNKDIVRIGIIDDRLWKSLGRDFGTFLAGVALMGVGSLLDNGAMEIAGFFVWVIFILAIVGRTAKTTYTIEEARQKLDDLEGKTT